jgi:hypothetical protein
VTALDTLACELVRLLSVETDVRRNPGVVGRDVLDGAADRAWSAALPALSTLDTYGARALRSMRIGIVSRDSIVTAMISCGAAMCRAARESEPPPITQREPDEGATETP